MNSMMKKGAIVALSTVMLVGGATAAFADDNRGNGKNKKNEKFKYGLPPGIAKKVDLHLHFKDVEVEADWALRYIASLASKRVFEGYEDGTFKPGKVINRIEAITAAVRLMGLRDEAESAEEMNSHLNFKDANKIKEKYPWAVGYVAVAAENDLFLETDNAVNPEKEADRLWATTLLVKAMKMEDEAKAKMNVKLDFKDAHQIPAGSVGYIAVAVEEGLIDGYEDGTFRPNRPVTRAELAALLDRTGEQLPEYNNSVVRGTVSAEVDGKVLTIVQDGKKVQYSLHEDAFILRDGKKGSSNDLEVGDEIKFYVNNNLVTYIEVTKEAEEQAPANESLTGTVTSAVYNNELKIEKNGKTSTVKLNSDTRIYRNGDLISSSGLKIGDQVEAFVYNNVAVFVEVTRPVDQNNERFEVEGKFHSLTLNNDGQIATISIMTVQNSQTQLRVYNVDKDVDIVGNASLLEKDRKVELSGKNNVVTLIEIK